LVFCIGLQFGLGRPLAAAGALVMAVNPSFTFLALQPMSDVTAAFWSVVLIWAALRSRENERWLFAAGAAFGVAFLVRPTNVVMLAPLVFLCPLERAPVGTLYTRRVAIGRSLFDLQPTGLRPSPPNGL
jgi:4-amino-4-deoxy-L-arabinose transferase-like glycosyltransferase